METSKLVVHRLAALAALFLVSGISAGTTISASEIGTAPLSVKVRFGGLDLATPDGVAELYARIRSAARSVCGYADTHFFQAQAAWNECVDRTIGHAVTNVGNAKLTAYYLGKSGRRGALAVSKTSSVVDRLP